MTVFAIHKNCLKGPKGNPVVITCCGCKKESLRLPPNMPHDQKLSELIDNGFTPFLELEDDGGGIQHGDFYLVLCVACVRFSGLNMWNPTGDLNE